MKTTCNLNANMQCDMSKIQCESNPHQYAPTGDKVERLEVDQKINVCVEEGVQRFQIQRNIISIIIHADFRSYRKVNLTGYRNIVIGLPVDAEPGRSGILAWSYKFLMKAAENEDSIILHEEICVAKSGIERKPIR